MLETVGSLSFELICGFAGWSVTVLPISIPVYFLLKLVMKENGVEEIAA